VTVERVLGVNPISQPTRESGEYSVVSSPSGACMGGAPAVNDFGIWSLDTILCDVMRVGLCKYYKAGFTLWMHAACMQPALRS